MTKKKLFPTELSKIFGLLFHMDHQDQARIESMLLEQRKRAWRTALQDCGRRHGYTGPVYDPRRSDLDHIKRMCKDDAASIVRTYNRDVDRELRRLYESNPKGNRRYYAKQMQSWHKSRDGWKSPQIANYTEQSTREYANMRFIEMNQLDGLGFLFQGLPPVCSTCIYLYGLGVVDKVFIRSHKTPIHLNCGHEWREVDKRIIKAKDIWVGQ